MLQEKPVQVPSTDVFVLSMMAIWSISRAFNTFPARLNLVKGAMAPPQFVHQIN